MKQAQALFFFLIALINLVKAQEPIASAHCNFDEGFYSFIYIHVINFDKTTNEESIKISFFCFAIILLTLVRNLILNKLIGSLFQRFRGFV